MKDTNKVLCKQDMILLKRSDETKNTEIYGNLYECLQKYESITIKELEQDSLFDDKAKLALLHNKKKMMDHIMEEWYAKTSFETATEEVHCQLCGTKNVFVCYIANKINNEELHVGRECVKKFKDINGLNVALNRLTTQIRDKEKDKRRIEFDIQLGKDINFTKDARMKLDKFPLILPEKIYHELDDCIVECNRTRSVYISSGGTIKTSLKHFDEKKRLFEQLILAANMYYNKNKTNPLAGTRELRAWLKKNNPVIIEKIRKANGLLGEKTLQYIYEPKFIRNNLSMFSSCLDEDDISITEITEKAIVFAINNQRFMTPIFFRMQNKDFMKKIGCYCLTKDNYKFGKNDLVIEIQQNQSNASNIQKYLIQALKGTEYTLIEEEKVANLYWKKRQNKGNKWSSQNEIAKPVYKSVTLAWLFNLMGKILLIEESEHNISKIIVKQIEKSGHWITEEEKNRNVGIALESAGMQKQREFIPYS